MTWCTAEPSRPGTTAITAWRAVAAAALIACGAAFAPAAHARSLAEAEAALARAESKDRTLHQLQAGVAALREAKLDVATRHLDEALDAIESVYSNAEGAAKARSLWYEEGAKDYKGEPYERAMAFYYRGLVYLTEADYENARASFRTALMQSSFAEEQRYRSGFATLMFLDGWCSQMLGDASQAADAYAEVAKYRKDWTPPSPDASTLVVAELAGAPRKVGDGVGNHEIVYRRAKRTPEKRIEIAQGATPLRLYPMEDLYVQATHRGTRAIDRIIDGKVTFQKATGAIGDAAANLASEGALINVALDGSAGRALGGLAAAGAIVSLVSANVKPRADVRYWSNLPESLHLATLGATAAPLGELKLFDEAGQPVASDELVRQEWTDPKGRRLVWIKTRR